MADGTIGINEPATIDKRLDADALSVSGTEVLRERVRIAGANDVDLAPVSATTGLTVDVADRALRDMGKVDIAGSDLAASAGMFVRLTDGTDTALVAADGSLQVAAATLPLPTGAAIEGKQLPDGHNVTVASIPGAISAGNSSTALLGISATFTGTWEEVKNYSSIAVIVYANVASAASGLKFQWGSDGTNADAEDVVDLGADAGRAFLLSVRGRYFRVVYVNGVVAQTTFRLSTLYHPTANNNIQRPLDRTIDDNYFAQLVRSVLAAKRNDGVYQNIRCTNGGNLKISLEEIEGAVVVPVSAASLPLPAGAATSALQLPNSHDVTIDNAAGAAAVNIQDGGNVITVDGAVTVSGTVTADTELPAAAALADGASAAPTTPTVGAVGLVMNATTVDRQRAVVAAMDTVGTGVAAAGILGQFDDVSTAAVTENQFAPVRISTRRALLVEGVASGTAQPVSGSVTVSGTATVTQGSAGTAWEMVGDVAADIAVPANPVVVGGRASTAVPAAVSSDGDSVNTWLTRQGANVVTAAPHVGIFGSQPWNLTSKTAQYATQQTSTILVDGGASERLVVTNIQIQAHGTTAGTIQVYFGTGAYARGTNLAIFDGEFAPSATLKPGVVMQGPFISAANGDDILVTTSAAMTVTVSVWYYVVT